MKKMKFLKSLLLVSLTIFSLSCSKGTDPIPVDMGYDYYPLTIGNTWVYDVQEIDKNTLADDTTQYQLKEVVAELVDGGDEDNYLLYRYKRASVSDTWVIDSVWSAKKETHYLIKTENNIRFQKLVFGVALGLSWDGNLWNVFEEETYTIVNLDIPYELNSIAYDEVLEVEQKVDKNLILSVDSREHYARGVGLIEVYKENLETQPGEKTLGMIYHQTLSSYLIVD